MSKFVSAMFKIQGPDVSKRPIFELKGKHRLWPVVCLHIDHVKQEFALYQTRTSRARPLYFQARHFHWAHNRTSHRTLSVPQAYSYFHSSSRLVVSYGVLSGGSKISKLRMKPCDPRHKL